MDSVGELLKSERENQNKTLKQIARETRISKTTLAALEEGNSRLLPPPAYVRGFIRLYAQELGIDADEALHMYAEELRETPKWEPQKELKGPPPSFVGRHALTICFAVCVLAAACTVGYLWFLYAPADQQVVVRHAVPERAAQPPEPPEAARELMPPAEEKPGQPEQSVGEPDTGPPAPAPTTASAAGAEPAPEPEAPEPAAGAAPEVIAGYETGTPFTVKIAASELVWIRIAVDEKEPFEVMLYPGESYTRQAQVMELRIGNPGGITLYYNGKALELEGDPDKPVDLQLPEAAKQLEER